MAEPGLLLAARKFRQDKKMLYGMLIDLRRGKPIQTRVVAAEFFAHILRLERGEAYNKHIVKILVNGRLVRKLVRCLTVDENDLYLKRYAAEALSNLLVYGDEADKHVVDEMGGRAALIEMIQVKADRQLRTSAVMGTLQNIRSCEQCLQVLRESSLLDRLPAILLDELDPDIIDGGAVRRRRLKLVSDLIEALIDGSPASAVRVFSHARLRREIVARINYGAFDQSLASSTALHFPQFTDNDEIRIVLRGVLVKSVVWCQDRRLLKEDGLMAALDKLKSIGNSEKSAEVEQATSLVREACEN